MDNTLHILVNVPFITRNFSTQFMFHFSRRITNLSPRIIGALTHLTVSALILILMRIKAHP
jgi:hypothetical protein